MIKHILHATRIGLTGFVAGVAVYFALQGMWWRFASYDNLIPTVVVPIEVTNENNQVGSNEPVQLEIFVNKPRDISPTNLSNRFFCDDGQFYEGKGVNTGIRLPVGIYERNVEFFAPAGLPVGKTCTFTFTQDYVVNPFRTVTRIWTSERFEVIE